MGEREVSLESIVLRRPPGAQIGIAALGSGDHWLSAGQRERAAVSKRVVPTGAGIGLDRISLRDLSCADDYRFAAYYRQIKTRNSASHHIRDKYFRKVSPILNG